MAKIKCPDCEASLTVDELRVDADTEADEGGVHVVFPYTCPNCNAPINDRRLKPYRGYSAPSNEEPLRWES